MSHRKVLVLYTQTCSIYWRVAKSCAPSACVHTRKQFIRKHACASGASQLTLVSFPSHGRTFAARCIFIRRCNRRCTRISTMWTTGAYYGHLSAARMALSVKNRLEAIGALRGFLRCGLLQLPFKT